MDDDDSTVDRESHARSLPHESRNDVIPRPAGEVAIGETHSSENQLTQESYLRIAKNDVFCWTNNIKRVSRSCWTGGTRLFDGVGYDDDDDDVNY
ncbi:jg1836, partial [Pararge aegeria aegeria]